MHLVLEFRLGVGDIDVMSKEQAKSSRKGSYTVAGITRDGISILKAGKATHFTERQARQAIAKVRSLAASTLSQSHPRSK